MKSILLVLCLILLSLIPTYAAGSDTVKEPKAKSKSGVADYNEGTLLLKQMKFAEAQVFFEKALKANEKFPQAHNNLAFVLRKQSPDNFPLSLTHYNRAIELEPMLAEAYMYRGALYTAMGKADLAKLDLEKLKSLSSPLAAELEEIITTGREETPDKFYGVTPELK